MAIKRTKLSKYEFFKKLKDFVGFSGTIKLMHAFHLIATVEVTPAKGYNNRFDVTVKYAGNTLKKRLANSFKSDASVDRITAIYGWNSLGCYEEQIFDWRTFEIEEVEVKVEPVKTDYIPGTDVTIEGTPKKVNAPTFFDMKPGQCFWYDDNLYQKTDCDTAILLKDGTVEEELLDDENVVPQKITIICMG